MENDLNNVMSINYKYENVIDDFRSGRNSLAVIKLLRIKWPPELYDISMRFEDLCLKMYLGSPVDFNQLNRAHSIDYLNDLLGEFELMNNKIGGIARKNQSDNLVSKDH